MYFNNNSNNRYNNRSNNYYNKNNNYNSNYYNRNNVFNSNFNNNQQSPKGQSLNITGVFLTLLLVLTALIMVFHVVNVIDTNNKLKEEYSENKDNVQDNEAGSEIIETPVDKEDEDEEGTGTGIESSNKDELVKLCKMIDSSGSYKYDEYIKYVDSFNIDGLSDAEIYEIMSKKTYCYEGMCVKIEKEGLINYIECSSGKYTRITFTEYEKIKEAQTKIDEALINSCTSVNDEGSFDSGAATGIRVTCDNYVCKTEYNDEIFTKKCK